MSMGWETVWTAQAIFLPRRQVRTQAAKIRPKSARNPLTIPSRRVTDILIWSGAMITASHFGPNAEDLCEIFPWLQKQALTWLHKTESIWHHLALYFAQISLQKKLETEEFWHRMVSAASSHRICSRGTWTSTSMARVANSKLLIVSDALEIEGLMHTSLSGIPFCWAPPSVGSFSWSIVACCGKTGLIWHNTIDNIIQYHTVQYIQFPNKSVDIRQTTEAAAQLQRRLAISTKGITEDPRLIITRATKCYKKQQRTSSSNTYCMRSIVVSLLSRNGTWGFLNARAFTTFPEIRQQYYKWSADSLQFSTVSHDLYLSFMDSSFVLLHVMYFIWMFRHGLSTINHNTCPTVGH